MWLPCALWGGLQGSLEERGWEEERFIVNEKLIRSGSSLLDFKAHSNDKGNSNNVIIVVDTYRTLIKCPALCSASFQLILITCKSVLFYSQLTDEEARA